MSVSAPCCLGFNFLGLQAAAAEEARVAAEVARVNAEVAAKTARLEALANESDDEDGEAGKCRVRVDTAPFHSSRAFLRAYIPLALPPGGADAASGDKWGLGNVDKYGLPLKDKPAKAFVSTGDEIDDLLNELDDW